jgi:hypothetical protein
MLAGASWHQTHSCGLGSRGDVVGAPFGANIDGIPTSERALEIATVLAEHVPEWPGEPFDC